MCKNNYILTFITYFMRFGNIVSGVVAFAAFALVSCEEIEHYGIPQVAVTSGSELSFDIEGGKDTFSFTSTRDWKIESDADWVVVDPEKGSAAPDGQTVEVSVLKNEGRDRIAELELTIGMLSRTITVNQKGPQGSPEDLIVYFNDFDKEVAQKTYGSGSSFPYLDQFDGWVNHTGTGVKDVKYNFSGMSTRSNSTSDSNYSDYAGSGTTTCSSVQTHTSLQRTSPSEVRLTSSSHSVQRSILRTTAAYSRTQSSTSTSARTVRSGLSSPITPLPEQPEAAGTWLQPTSRSLQAHRPFLSACL